jgi:Sec7 domain
LTACNVLKPSPREIASFLFAHKERFDPSDLGVFLSEGGTGGQEVEHWKMVRYLYIRSISFIDLQLDEG